MQKLGIQPRLSEVTNSPFAKFAEDISSRNLGGRGIQERFIRSNELAANRAAAGSIGQTADELTHDVFADANKQIGAVFNQLVSLPGRPIKIGSQVASAADDVIAQQSKLHPEVQISGGVLKLIQDAKRLATLNGRIDGETYKLTRTALSNKAEDAFSAGNSMDGQIYKKMVNALDESAQDSLRNAGHADLADNLNVARKQWGNLLTLERGKIAEAGDVSPARLAQRLSAENPMSFREGRNLGNPLYDLATIGETMKGPRAGSQTAERGPMWQAALAIPSIAAAKLTTSPIAAYYGRHVANTPGARNAAAVLEQLTRAQLAQKLGQMLPVMPENNAAPFVGQ
jgi:hypothetical protein